MNASYKLSTVTYILISLLISLYLLVVAKDFLVPLIIAIFIWNVINTIAASIHRIRLIGRYLPYWICIFFACVILISILWGIVQIITNNVNEIITALPHYQNSLLKLTNNIDTTFHIKSLAKLNEAIRNFNLPLLLTGIYSVGSFVSSAVTLIVLYIIFLFLEQQVFRAKIAAIFSDEDARYLTLNIFSHIINDIQKYLSLKTFANVLTAGASWVVMKLVGLDFAEFWALLIFILNYIPNIGAIIATIFPVTLAIIQLQEWSSIFILIASLITIEFTVGSLLEPRLLGTTLNLSPLIILISLAVWGTIWGFIGMFLAVPITETIMIICSHFKSSRPIAVILSQNGKLPHYD